MDLYYLGHSCFKIKGKKTIVIIDPFDPKLLGLKFPPTETDIVTISHEHPDHNFLNNIVGSPIVLRGVGEYEVKGVKIYSFPSYHDDKKGLERGLNTIFQFSIDGINILHLGDLGHKLKPENIEEIKTPDILLLPVGGYYTIDANIASEVAANFEPKIIIPMHYKKPGENEEFTKNLNTLEIFLKRMGIENPVSIPKLHINKDTLPAETQIIILS